MKKLLLILPLALLACQNSKRPDLHKMKIPAFGSYLEISYTGPEIPGMRETLEQFVQDFNASLSTYDPNSLISRINRNETQTLDSLNWQVLAKAAWMTRASGGAFDVAVGPLTELWGFGETGPREVDSAEVEAARRLCGYGKYTIQRMMLTKSDTAVRLDYNAIAPGFAADLLSQELNRRNIRNYYVNVGGEIRCLGVNEDSAVWTIGIQRPVDNPKQDDAIRYVRVNNRALATSGNYRRFYVRDGIRYSHTIDPRTGYPVKHNLLSVSILAPDAITADALATTCMVLGREGAIEFLKSIPGTEYYFISGGPDGTFLEEWSPGFASEFVE